MKVHMCQNFEELKKEVHEIAMETNWEGRTVTQEDPITMSNVCRFISMNATLIQSGDHTQQLMEDLAVIQHKADSATGPAAERLKDLMQGILGEEAATPTPPWNPPESLMASFTTPVPFSVQEEAQEVGVVKSGGSDKIGASEIPPTTHVLRHLLKDTDFKIPDQPALNKPEKLFKQGRKKIEKKIKRKNTAFKALAVAGVVLAFGGLVAGIVGGLLAPPLAPPLALLLFLAAMVIGSTIGRDSSKLREFDKLVENKDFFQSQSTELKDFINRKISELEETEKRENESLQELKNNDAPYSQQLEQKRKRDEVRTEIERWISASKELEDSVAYYAKLKSSE